MRGTSREDLRRSSRRSRRLTNRPTATRVGFSQVYLYVIVVVDSRELNIGKGHSYDGLSNDHRGLVRNALSLAGLDARVGFLQAELAQTADDPPLWPSSFGAE